MLTSFRTLLRPYRQVAFSKRTGSGYLNRNQGLLTNAERGDAFSDPQVYKSSSNVTSLIKGERKTRRLLREERQRKESTSLQLGQQAAESLQRGTRLPLSPNERRAARLEDEEMVSGADQVGETYTRQLRNLSRQEVDRRSHMMDKFGQPPTSREFHKMFTQLRQADDDDEEVESYQTRLVEENGIYPSTRVDAFMLDDEAFFPDWVHALPYRLRDRVKYGSLGLTEEDEALRVRLARMPRDRRLNEWKRLKKAKEYQAAKEETLTLAELRDVRQGKRRFHWLQRKRSKRASLLRRMALRKPESVEEWPSNVVDHSQRIAFIAQHVENGLETKGAWPLDADALARAKIKRRQEEAQRTFLLTPEEKKLAAASSPIHGEVRQLLDAFDTPEKGYKKLSRKVYANRVNAIVHGDQDAHGRKYRKMYQKSTRRQRAYDSMAEMGLEKEVRKEPSVNVSGLNHTDDEHWSRHERSWVGGMPSTRYGS